jgi:uncharacterized protein
MSTSGSPDSDVDGLPLDDDHLARLDELLEALNPDGAMLLEELDGFFAAWVCGSAAIDFDAILVQVLGLEEGDQPAFGSPERRVELSSLLARHRASIARALAAGEGFSPILMHDDDGRIGANLWAIGFLRGISLDPEGWESIEDDEELVSLLEPFEALAEEIDMRSGDVRAPVPDDERQNLIDAMAEAAFQFYAHFESERSMKSGEVSPEPPEASPRRH